MNELDILLRGRKTDSISSASESATIREIATLLQKRPLSPFARSICVRMVDAGSSNDVEIEEGLMNSPQVDCERFGIHFVASPRHADVLLVSGPVTINMKLALEKTYAAMPYPKAVVAAGDGACSGGVLSDALGVYKSGRVDEVIPISVKVPGNPPTPYELVLGILKAGEMLSRQKD
ncbi:putative membrane-bound hydrogenase subunit mbhJ [Candidatus Anstonella stagnisolia]|nr:putative membrane-bound hydrogenase subunit mbhJ [Candidatus Anstonella stagnisolia]